MTDSRGQARPAAIAIGIAASFLASIGAMTRIGRRRAGAFVRDDADTVAEPCSEREIQAAALPWRRSADGVEILLVTASSGSRWILPKGGVKAGETLSKAAAREAQEEAGLIGTIGREEIGRYNHRKTEHDEEVTCEVHVFPLAAARLDSDWEEKSQRQWRWVPASEVPELVGETDLAELIARFAQSQARG